MDNAGTIWVGVTHTSAGAECPGCGSWSNRIHGSYLRFPADLPSAGRRVALRPQGQVRRFSCAYASCVLRTSSASPSAAARYFDWSSGTQRRKAGRRRPRPLPGGT
ncbi:transposase family protein [Streptomyces sp. NPDC048312]|uniref:transposase family protein n=1 Tax=unclassified Streptomyces TaxID=2593676 RepID=UPI0033E92A39